MRAPARARATAPADAALMQRLATGELGVLGDIYDRYHACVRRFISRATNDSEDVDDLVHATFLTLAQTAARFDGRASCRPWLFGIAARLVRHRRTRLGRIFAILTQLGRTHPASADPRTRLDARRSLERALETLSEAKRITILMAEVEGLTCPEIAEALEVPIGTVWTRLHAARRDLRAALEDT